MKIIKLFFSLFVLIFISILLFNIIGEDSEVKFFPLIALVPAFVLSAIQSVKDLIIFLERSSQNSGHTQKEEENGFVSKEYLSVLIWMTGFLILLYITGFLLTILLFIFGYQKYYGTNWTRSISSAAITTFLIWALFIRALHYPLYAGILFS